MERAFVFFVLLLSTGAFQNLAVTPGDVPDAASGQANMQVLWILIYLVTIVLLFRTCKDAIRYAAREYLLLALVLLALGSMMWSADPGVSLRRGAALVLTCLFGVYFASRFTLREQLHLLAGICGTCVVFSLVFGILGIGTPVVDVIGSWYGVFVHKNVLGRMMVLCILVFLTLVQARSEKKSLLWIGAGLAFVLLLLSRSTTSLAVLVAMLAFLPFCGTLRRGKSPVARIVLFAAAVSTLGLYWVSNHLMDILQFLGKDVTLTGRLQLWILSVTMALRRPWLGYGYNAFWLGPGSSSARLLAAIQWDAPHAHNGLLEIWLELGLVGVGLFLVGFGIYLVRAAVFLRHQRTPGAIWPMCFLAFMFLSNLTESDFLARNAIFFILYVAVVITVSPKDRRYGRLTALNVPEGELA